MVSKSFHQYGFIIDSGAFQHIEKELGFFSLVEMINPVTVHLADNTFVTTKQHGSVLLKLCTHRKGSQRNILVLVTETLYITEDGVNILSCSQMDKAEIYTRFDNGHCSLIDRLDKTMLLVMAHWQIMMVCVLLMDMFTMQRKNWLPQ